MTDGAQARYLLPAGGRHLLTMGVQAWRTTGDPQRYIDSNAPDFDNNLRNDPFDLGEIRSTGLYLQDEIDLGRVKLLAGVRADRVEGDARSQGVQARTEGLKRSDDSLSWSVGAVWELTPSLRPYANISRAWRAADLRERFEDSARGDGYYHVGNPALNPERATGIEFGLRGRADRIDWRLAAFHTRIDDYIAGRVTGATAPGTGLPVKLMENLDRAVLRGFEGSAEMPAGPVTVDLAFTWLRGDNWQTTNPWSDRAARTPIGVASLRTAVFTGARSGARRPGSRVATASPTAPENPTPGFTTRTCCRLEVRPAREPARRGGAGAPGQPIRPRLPRAPAGRRLRARDPGARAQPFSGLPRAFLKWTDVDSWAASAPPRSLFLRPVRPPPRLLHPPRPVRPPPAAAASPA